MADPSTSVRVLLLADSHLGFDLPVRPRVERRRRGLDFLANHRAALAPALDGAVDLVVHGGDVFHRSRVPKSLIYQAFQPMVEVARRGLPVLVVPGNHERSRIPHSHLAAHPRLHIFSHPRTLRIQVRGLQVAITGFPYERRNVRERFPGILQGTDWYDPGDDLRLLTFHHCVEGATVGPADFTFKTAKDVVRCEDLPTSFAAVLSGHIHRQQVLTADLRGNPLPTPVVYPGSVERTAFAEKDEVKGFMILTFSPSPEGGRLAHHEFNELPARPMAEVDIVPASAGAVWRKADLDARLRQAVQSAPMNAVLRIKVQGDISEEARPLLTASCLRTLAPPSMNLDVVVPGRNRPFKKRERRTSHSLKSSHQTALALGE